MSGIIAVYGLVIAVLIAGDLAPPPTQNMSLYTYAITQQTGEKKKEEEEKKRENTFGMIVMGLTFGRGFMHLASGLSVGLAGVAAGYTIGIVGDAVSTEYWSTFHPQGADNLPGRPCIHAAIPSIRRNDSNLDFRRSSWTLRVCLHPF